MFPAFEIWGELIGLQAFLSLAGIFRDGQCSAESEICMFYECDVICIKLGKLACVQDGRM
jgi:hypothetical protein